MNDAAVSAQLQRVDCLADVRAPGEDVTAVSRGYTQPLQRSSSSYTSSIKKLCLVPRKCAKRDSGPSGYDSKELGDA